MLGIIGAMKVEVENLKKLISNCTVESVSNIEYYRGELFNKEIVVAQSGVGKVNAAICAQTMILKYAPELIINIGVAGGIGEGINLGDVVIATGVIQHDVDTSAVGDPVGMVSGINLIEIPCSADAVNLLKNAAVKMDAFKVHMGIIASGDQFLNSRTKTMKIGEAFGAIACEMESGSIGQVCYINNTKFAIIRAISDSGDSNSGFDYNKFVQTAANNSIALITNFLKAERDI